MLVSLLDYKSLPRVINFYCAVYHQYTDLSYNDSGQLEWFGWSVWSSGWGDFVVQLVEVFEWLGLSRLSELCFTQGRQVGHWSVCLGW